MHPQPQGVATQCMACPLCSEQQQHWQCGLSRHQLMTSPSLPHVACRREYVIWPNHAYGLDAQRAQFQQACKRCADPQKRALMRANQLRVRLMRLWMYGQISYGNAVQLEQDIKQGMEQGCLSG